MLSAAAGAPAQERFSFFQASTPESAERMLKLANLRDDDVVVDLGSGDGLIVLTAAKMNAKVRGWGVDIDEKLVAESNGVAKAQGVADRVKFFHQNAFDADLREATVVTMWLFPELMRLLRPTLLERARPGTRVLTSTWDLGTWPVHAARQRQPDRATSGSCRRVSPATGAGSLTSPASPSPTPRCWNSNSKAPKASSAPAAGANREVLSDMKLNGENISFNLVMTLEGIGLTRHEFSGKVRGERIEGTAQVLFPEGNQLELPWGASRTTGSEYFAPTGVNMP